MDDRCKGCDYLRLVDRLLQLVASFPSLSPPPIPPSSIPTHLRSISNVGGECEGGIRDRIIDTLARAFRERVPQISDAAWAKMIAALDPETFPGIDIPSEIRKAKAWELANPTRRKTARGLPRFLVGWMSRQQDRGGKTNQTSDKTGRPHVSRNVKLCGACGADCSSSCTVVSGRSLCDGCYEGGA